MKDLRFPGPRIVGSSFLVLLSFLLLSSFFLPRLFFLFACWVGPACFSVLLGCLADWAPGRGFSGWGLQVASVAWLFAGCPGFLAGILVVLAGWVAPVFCPLVLWRFSDIFSGTLASSDAIEAVAVARPCNHCRFPIVLMKQDDRIGRKNISQKVSSNFPCSIVLLVGTRVRLSTCDS